MGACLGVLTAVGLTVAYRKYTKHMREKLERTQLELGDVTEDRDMTRGLLDDTRVEIEERINKIRWCKGRAGPLFLLSTNDKTIKLWKIYEKKVRMVTSRSAAPG